MGHVKSGVHKILEHKIKQLPDGEHLDGLRAPGQTVPVGVIEFDHAAASALNQKPFHLDLRLLARVPPLRSWLPRLEAPNSGIIAQADRALRDRINAAAEQLARRHPEVIQVRGISAPPSASISRP